VLACACVFAPPAVAKKVNAPPGNGSAGEYLEVVPTPHGDQRSDSFPPGGGGSTRGQGPGGQAVRGPDARTTRALSALGARGRAAAEFAQRTAPPRIAHGRRGSGHSGGGSDLHGFGATKGVHAGRSDSPLGATIKRLVGGDDAGSSLLPLTLVVTALGLTAIALLRRREPS
jgi:hypothetical protein